MLTTLGKEAKKASLSLAQLTTGQKNKLLKNIASALKESSTFILEENAKDMSAARQAGLPPAMLDRLLLTEERLEAIADDVMRVVALPDPIGQVIDGGIVGEGLFLQRKRVPLGVVAVIYEARPNVTVDIATLCIKTGNAAILRGGSETINSNIALVGAIHNALKYSGLSAACVQSINDPDRALIKQLLKMDDYVDIVIPRGGKKLQELCVAEARMPVIIGGIGVCHIYVDETADIAKSLPILENAKVQRPSVCNTVETLLVHANIAEVFLPQAAALMKKHNVTLHACPKALSILSTTGVNVVPWAEEELMEEWLSLDLNVGIVDEIDTAIDHIRTYGSQHSDAILTQSMKSAEKFVAEVDSAAVYVNTSTRFTDGGQFGLGAEVAVSTQKTHARGPVGLTGLTSYKWIGTSDYSIRE